MCVTELIDRQPASGRAGEVERSSPLSGLIRQAVYQNGQERKLVNWASMRAAVFGERQLTRHNPPFYIRGSHSASRCSQVSPVLPSSVTGPRSKASSYLLRVFVRSRDHIVYTIASGRVRWSAIGLTDSGCPLLAESGHYATVILTRSNVRLRPTAVIFFIDS